MLPPSPRAALRFGAAAFALLLPATSPADPDRPGRRAYPAPGVPAPPFLGRVSAVPAAVPVSYGLLWLELEPLDAQISLDGEILDKGVWLISMEPGLHDVDVSKEGFLPWSRRLGIGPGESLRISVRLEKEPPK